jgi:hypothetical protein
LVFGRGAGQHVGQLRFCWCFCFQAAHACSSRLNHRLLTWRLLFEDHVASLRG